MKRKWRSVAYLLIGCLLLAVCFPMVAQMADSKSKSPVTLRIWMKFNASAGKYIKSFAENEAFKQAMKDTGVKLEFIHPPIGQENEHFNLMVASGDIPDIMVEQRYKGGDVQGVKDGLFEDLTKLVPKYAPAYYDLMKKNPEFKREATTPDGKIYSFYSYKDVPASVEGEWYRAQFRADWLQEFNMEVPKTIEQYEAYFKKVLETKPGVAPFVLAQSGYETQLFMPFDIFTITNSLSHMPVDGFYVKNGKIHWSQIEPGFKDYLELMNKWYKAGYISKDFAAIDYNLERQLFEAGKTACIFNSSNTVFTRCKALGIKVITGPYPRLKEGQKLHGSYYLFPRNQVWGSNISAKSKHKIEAVKFIDYGYSEKGFKTFAYGPEGLAWTAGPNGQPQYTDYVLNNPKYSVTDVDYIIRFHEGWTRYRDSDRYSIPMNTKDPETLNNRLRWADDPSVDAAYRLPLFSILPDDNTRRGKIMNDISTYADEMTLKFIIGAEPLANFDKYVRTIKSMGIDEAIAITQKAYDAHMKKK